MTTDDLLTCPLCDWAEERTAVVYAVGNATAAPAVAAALGMPASGLLAIHHGQNVKRDEATLERHLRSHGPHDWLPALMQARAAIEKETMMTDAESLRTRAREAAEGSDSVGPIEVASFIEGYLAHAAQQPTRDQIANVLALHEMEPCGESRPGYRAQWWHCQTCHFETERREFRDMQDALRHQADAVLALLNGADR